ncbi:hypothetical protein BDF14DRAFT_1923430 [Spinellus fusiger]|nr:hypothetical protein BDF14DRAFT_1923430 [Spinellus fusiger]
MLSLQPKVHFDGDQQVTTPQRSSCELEINYDYLVQQNALLLKELAFSRYTIKALKDINVQKNDVLLETRQELDKAYLHIKLLGMTLMRHQQQQHSTLLADPLKPLLISDVDSSDDQELSEEEESHANSSIMKKLPLRRPVRVCDY